MITIHTSLSNPDRPVNATAEAPATLPRLARTLVVELRLALRAAGLAERNHRDPRPVRALYDDDGTNGH